MSYDSPHVRPSRPIGRLAPTIQTVVNTGAAADIADRVDAERAVALRRGFPAPGSDNSGGRDFGQFTPHQRPDGDVGFWQQLRDAAADYGSSVADVARETYGVGAVAAPFLGLSAMAYRNLAEQQEPPVSTLPVQRDVSRVPLGSEVNRLNPGEIAQRNINRLNPGEIAAQNAAKAKEDVFSYAQAMAMAEQNIAELNRLQLEAIQAGADEIAAKYDEQIAEQQEALDDAKVKMALSMQAYESYSAEAQAAYTASIEAATAGEAAMQEAMSGRVEAVDQAITEGFDAAVEDVEEVADLIGYSGTAPLSENFSNAVRIFEDMLVDAARSDISGIGRIAEAGAKFATAAAKSAQAENAYMTDVEREKVEIKIQDEIDTLIDNIAELNEAKKEAVQAALDQYEPMSGFDNPEDAWQFVFETLAVNEGWDLNEIDAVKALWNDMKNKGTFSVDAVKAAIDDMVIAENYDVLAEYLLDVLPPQYTREGVLPAAIGGLIQDIVEDPNSEKAARTRDYIARQYGVDISDADLAKLDWASKSDYDNLLTVAELWQEHVDNWNQSRYVSQKTGTSAPNNYANRNHPAYVHRREVTVPNFVNEFMAKFHPGASRKKYVGGYQYIRPPSDVGGGKAPNSDHQSGGAVDLYADTEEERLAIERWADQHPCVSYVVYSGNKHHQGHHVHVSLKLNCNAGGGVAT